MAIAPLTGVDAQVGLALRKASARTGVSFDYLVETARRESNFDPTARSRTSSASGLFQFIEQTWLSTVHRSGARHGLGELARQIERNAQGRYFVPDQTVEKEILALRHDPQVAALMAGEITASNAGDLSARIGRGVRDEELYLAHFLGVEGAARLVSLAETRPDTSATAAFPEAAQANRAIFYDGSGKPRTAGDVYDLLTRRGQHGAGRTIADGTERPRAVPLAKMPVDEGMHPLQQHASLLSPSLIQTLAQLDPLAQIRRPAGSHES